MADQSYRTWWVGAPNLQQNLQLHLPGEHFRVKFAVSGSPMEFPNAIATMDAESGSVAATPTAPQTRPSWAVRRDHMYIYDTADCRVQEALM